MPVAPFQSVRPSRVLVAPQRSTPICQTSVHESRDGARHAGPHDAFGALPRSLLCRGPVTPVAAISGTWLFALRKNREWPDQFSENCPAQLETAVLFYLPC